MTLKQNGIINNKMLTTVMKWMLFVCSFGDNTHRWTQLVDESSSAHGDTDGGTRKINSIMLLNGNLGQNTNLI